MSEEENQAVSEEEDQVVEYWRTDEAIEEDLNNRTSPQEFLNELADLILNILKTNPELRPNIILLCNYELYENINKHDDLNFVFEAAKFNIPRAHYGSYRRIFRRVTPHGYNSENFTGIADKLRQVLGFEEGIYIGTPNSVGLLHMFLNSHYGTDFNDNASIPHEWTDEDRNQYNKLGREVDPRIK